MPAAASGFAQAWGSASRFRQKNPRPGELGTANHLRGLRSLTVAPPAIHGRLVQAKQAADLHSPSFNQRVVAEVVKDGFLDRHVPPDLRKNPDVLKDTAA